MQRRPITPPNARERLGGRAAGSTPVLAILCLLTTLIQLLPRIGVNIVALVDPTTMGGTSLALQSATIVAVYVLARLTVLRHRSTRPAPVWLAVLVAIVASAARLGVAIAVAGGVWPVLSTTDAVVTAISGVGFSTLVVLALTYLVATRTWYLETRERLIRLDVETEARRLRTIGALDALESVVVATAQSSLDGASAQARDAVERAESSPERAASALLEAARAGVRPTARDLTRVTTDRADYPRISFSWTIVREFHRRPLPIAVPCLIFLLAAPPHLLRATDLAGALVLTGLALIGIAVAFRLGRVIISRAPRGALPITVGASVIAIAPFWLAITQVPGVVEPHRAAIFSVVFLLAITAVVSFIQTLEDSGGVVLEALRAPLERTELERLAAEHARTQLEHEIGRYLHVDVQPQFVAASYAIQDAVERGDREALEDAIALARVTLDRRLTTAPRPGGKDVVTEVVAQWAGILSVTWEPTDIPPEAQTAEVADVIRECLSNAIIHGHADRANVTVSAHTAHIEICIVDNGRGPQPGGPGLGSATLNEATGGDWSIARADGGGAVVRARVPRDAASNGD